MTEIPEHLLQRSRDRRRAMGQDVPGDAPEAAPTASANAPAVAGAATPASTGPVPIPAAEPPPPTPPTSAWVAAAEGRKKIPYWVMPVLLFLPIWLIMYVGTLEEPTRESGVIYEGSVVYTEHGCAGCHGASGGGGIGPAFSGGAVISNFENPISQIAWIVHGTDGYADAGLETYGTSGIAVGGSGRVMPAFGAELTTEELIAVVFYERVELGGFAEELPLAEALWDQIEHGEIEALPEHFLEGADGDFEADIDRILGAAIAVIQGDEEEVAAG